MIGLLKGSGKLIPPTNLRSQKATYNKHPYIQARDAVEAYLRERSSISTPSDRAVVRVDVLIQGILNQSIRKFSEVIPQIRKSAMPISSKHCAPDLLFQLDWRVFFNLENVYREIKPINQGKTCK